jgi:hypothetical protein
VLDLDVMNVVLNGSQDNLTPDEKCFRYLKAIESYLYKRDPSVKVNQFNFEVQECDNGEVTHVFVPASSINSVKKFCRKYTPALIGPVFGVVLSALWKGFS